MTSSAASGSILCAGRLYCDLVFTGTPHLPEMGKEVFADGLSLNAGGGAFITAATIRALGVRASLLAQIPAPPFGDLVQKELHKHCIDNSLCRDADLTSAPQVTVVVTGKQDRAFLTHKAGPAMPDAIIPTGKWTHLHIGELRSLIEHPDLIPQARIANMTISLDCGWDEDLLSRGSEVAGLIAQTDLFLPNEVEFNRLCASGMAENAATTTVVKCGQKGAHALTGGVWFDEPASARPVVDATGAGDAFNGGFLVKWLAGAPLKSCLAKGNLCGAITVQYPGGTGGTEEISSTCYQEDTAIAP